MPQLTGWLSLKTVGHAARCLNTKLARRILTLIARCLAPRSAWPFCPGTRKFDPAQLWLTCFHSRRFSPYPRDRDPTGARALLPEGFLYKYCCWGAAARLPCVMRSITARWQATEPGPSTIKMASKGGRHHRTSETRAFDRCRHVLGRLVLKEMACKRARRAKHAPKDPRKRPETPTNAPATPRGPRTGRIDLLFWGTSFRPSVSWSMARGPRPDRSLRPSEPSLATLGALKEWPCPDAVGRKWLGTPSERTKNIEKPSKAAVSGGARPVRSASGPRFQCAELRDRPQIEPPRQWVPHVPCPRGQLAVSQPRRSFDTMPFCAKSRRFRLFMRFLQLFCFEDAWKMPGLQPIDRMSSLPRGGRHRCCAPDSSRLGYRSADGRRA